MDLQEVLQLLNGLSEADRESLVKLAIDQTNTQLFIPNTGPQTAAFYSDADELFYGGAAGGGKTALICGLAAQEHDKSLILRRTYPQLGGIFDECERILKNRDGLREQKKLWYLSDNRRIDFGSVPHEKDREDYQGRPHDLIAFDEITQFTESIYTYIIGWNRHANPDQRCRVVATGNPPLTTEGMWVIRYWAPWLDPEHPRPAKHGELRWYTKVNGEDVECAGPDDIPAGASDPPRSRTFIGAKLEDNPEYMASGYGSVLASMPEPMRTMLREGRFDVETVDNPFQVIPTKWIVQAQNRWIDNPAKHYAMNALGVDVAQGGKDNTVLVPRRDFYYDELIVLPGKDTPDGPTVATHVIRALRDQARVVVDVGGGYGGDTVTQLSQAGIDVRGFNGAAAAERMTTRDGMHGFWNMRAYGYWSFREALDPDFGSQICLPPDHQLLAQLAAPNYEVTPRGIKIESKQDIRERLGVSPDRADAVINAHMSHFRGLQKPKNLRSSVTSTTMQRKALTGRARSKYY